MNSVMEKEESTFANQLTTYMLIWISLIFKILSANGKTESLMNLSSFVKNHKSHAANEETVKLRM